MTPNPLDSVSSASYQGSDGAALHFLERPARNIAAETVVFLPSLFFGSTMFADVLNAMPAEWRLVCPDHRGQGRSESGTLRPTMGQLASDTAALIDALGSEPVHVVGSSMGGYVALELISQRPELLRSCVLSCCTAEAEQQPERFEALEASLRQQGAAAMVEALVATMFGTRFIEDGGEALAHWRAHLAAIDPRIPDAVHEVFARRSYVDMLREIRTPMLLVSGALDRAKNPADMQFIADRVKGSRHVVMDDSGHTPPIEEPERFAREVTRFIASTTLRESTH
ncbi:alpha/beta hydrolase [Variovorax rhizosphaerae]|uniref:Alpha/beta hydrolase n=1 Tax=Variovorax rhizosphaerae TaxID=1836200 RepID=A0ABU8WF50_9BURK